MLREDEHKTHLKQDQHKRKMLLSWIAARQHTLYHILNTRSRVHTFTNFEVPGRLPGYRGRRSLARQFEGITEPGSQSLDDS